MAAKGMALAEFLVKIGFNTAEINKQLKNIEDRLKKATANQAGTAKDTVKAEKSILASKQKQLTTSKALLVVDKARLRVAEAIARANGRAARNNRGGGRGSGGRGGGSGGGRGGSGGGNRGGGSGGGRGSRGNNAQNLAERKELLRQQAETMFRGGRISQGQLNRINNMISGAGDLRSLGLARGHLAQAAREARRLRSELNLSNVASQRLASSTRQMLGNYVSVFAMAGGAAMGARSSMAVESARAQLFGANFGDQAAANADYDFFRQMSLQYGTGMAESIKSFSGFKYAGGDIMDTAGMQELFKSVTLSGVAGGATQADMDRTFYALKQMASKGKISSEELNLQLAEANPLAKLGVTKAFEEAYGRPASEMMDMMKNGEVLAKDVLPLVAKHLNEISAKGVAAGMKTASKQFDIMRATAVDLAATFGESGGNAGLADIFRGFSQSMKQATPLIKVLGGLFKEFSTIVVAASHTFGGFAQSLGRNIQFISDKLGMAFGTGTAEGIRFWVKAVMWRFFPLLSMLREIMAIMEELFNFFETDPSKKIYGKLSNPEGTGAWDKWHTTSGTDLAQGIVDTIMPQFITDWGKNLGLGVWLADVKDELNRGVYGTTATFTGPITVQANSPEELADKVMEQQLTTSTIFLGAR